MSKLQQQKKKQARAKSVQEKLLKQRETRTQEQKAANYERRLSRMFRDKKRPFVNGTAEDAAAAALIRDMEIRTQLERNMEILKALEEENEREMAARQDINERLEGEGHHSLEDKMQALSSAIAQEQQDASVGGTAEVGFTIASTSTENL